MTDPRPTTSPTHDPEAAAARLETTLAGWRSRDFADALHEIDHATGELAEFARGDRGLVGRGGSRAEQAEEVADLESVVRRGLNVLSSCQDHLR